MHKYLFQLKINTYNNRQPFYEIKPLPNSDIKRAVLFGGQMQSLGRFKTVGRIRDIAITLIYLETTTLIEARNKYANVEKLCQMICLATGLPANSEEIKIDQKATFESIFDEYKHPNYFKEGAVYGGRITDFNPLEKVVAYSHSLHKIDSKINKKFENSLRTFCWAYELEMLPNPQLKYTLYMTLYLASINQLADNPKIKCDGHWICSECGSKIDMKHKTGSDMDEVRKLIRELITGKNVDEIIGFVEKMYGLRSKFLHSGSLGGKEKEGGFIVGFGNDKNSGLLEDLINLSTLNRKIIELFLQQKVKGNND